MIYTAAAVFNIKHNCCQAKVQRSLKVNELYLSLGDQKHNLEALKQALTDNKISSAIHCMAADVIKQSMQLPVMHLRSLFVRYIKFRQLQNAKENLQKKMKKVQYKNTEQMQEYLQVFLLFFPCF